MAKETNGVARIEQLGREIQALQRQVADLECEQQLLINQEALRDAEFVVGQDVLSHRTRYRITQVTGEHTEYEGRHRFYARYYGRRILKGGKLAERVKRLYSPKPDTSSKESL